MRAAVIERHGTAPILVDRPSPPSADGHALVTTTAAPITPLDILCASGSSYFGPPQLPYVPGVQGVGVVRQATAWAVGARVWFSTTAGMQPGDGSMAEHVAIPESELVALPDQVPDTLVAALGLSAVAAWMALTWKAALQPGEQVLVLGGGSVVGQVAIQAARLSGARRIVAAARSSRAQDRAAAAGADAVVALRDDDEPTALAGRLATGCEGGIDVVVDPLCGVPASAALQLLAPGARFVNLGGSAGDSATFASATLRSRSAAILGYTNNELSFAQKSRALADLLDHAAAGRLSVEHETVSFDDLPDAWDRQVEGRAGRRIVVDLT